MDVGRVTSKTGWSLFSPTRDTSPPPSPVRERLEAGRAEAGDPGTPFVRTRFGLLIRFDDDFPLIVYDRAEGEEPPAMASGAVDLRL